MSQRQIAGSRRIKAHADEQCEACDKTRGNSNTKLQEKKESNQNKRNAMKEERKKGKKENQKLN